jgi:hypothetical protein
MFSSNFLFIVNVFSPTQKFKDWQLFIQCHVSLVNSVLPICMCLLCHAMHAVKVRTFCITMILLLSPKEIHTHSGSSPDGQCILKLPNVPQHLGSCYFLIQNPVKVPILLASLRIMTQFCGWWVKAWLSEAQHQVTAVSAIYARVTRFHSLRPAEFMDRHHQRHHIHLPKHFF